jgi:hypothetical protein
MRSDVTLERTMTPICWIAFLTGLAVGVALTAFFIWLLLS